MIEWERGGIPTKIGMYLVCSTCVCDGRVRYVYNIVYFDGIMFDNYSERNTVVAFTKINRPK